MVDFWQSNMLVSCLNSGSKPIGEVPVNAGAMFMMGYLPEKG